MVGVADGRKIRDMLRAVPYCPISGNQPTRMTRASFLARCAREQARERKFDYSAAQYCDVCRGQKVPAEIDFIELDELKTGGEDMVEKTRIAGGAQTKKLEQCEACGRVTNKLRPALGLQACASCGVIITNANNRPELLLAQLKRLGKMPEAESVPSCEHCSSMLAEINRLDKVRIDLEEALAAGEKQFDKVKAQNAELHSRLEGALAHHQEDLDRLQVENKKYTESLAAAERDLDKAHRALHHERELASQLGAKIDQMIDAELYDRPPVVKDDLEATGPSRDSLLLDLALDILDGKVTGLDAGRLSAMRGVV